MSQQIEPDTTHKEIARRPRISQLPHGPDLNFWQWVGTSDEQPQSLTLGPFILRTSGRLLHLRYDERQAPITGHVLTMEEIEQLEALIQVIKHAPKVKEEDHVN
jgi:hypothetical protein